MSFLVGIDRVLMSTQEKGIESKEIHVEESPNQTVQMKEIEKASKGLGHGDYDCLNDQEHESRGKGIVVSVDDDKGGWATLIKFAKEREELNRGEERRGKTKKKGIREINNLGCSMNYEKTKEREVERHR